LQFHFSRDSITRRDENLTVIKSGVRLLDVFNLQSVRRARLKLVTKGDRCRLNIKGMVEVTAARGRVVDILY
jgi:hypothetical protein